MFHKYILFTFLFQALLLAQGAAVVVKQSEIEKSIKVIESLFEKKDYDRACKLVEKLYKKDPYSVKANLFTGKCAYYRENIDEAMAAYDRADILDEESAVVHKNLGDLYAHIGNIEIANSEYDKADRFGKDIIERSLDSLYSSNSFSVLARFSVGYDSNVEYNAELAEMQSWFGDSSYANEAKSDSYLKEYMKITHSYDEDAFSSFYYKNQLYIYNKNYRELNENDFTQIQLYSGPAWASKDFDFWLPVSYTYVATNYQDYERVYSINPQLRKKFENGLLLRVEAEYAAQQYRQWSDGDKDIYLSSISLSRWFEKSYFKGSYKYEEVEKHQNDSLSIFIDRYLNELEINYTYLLSKSLEFGVEYLYSKTIYSDLANITIPQRREDVLHKYSAYMSYNVTNNLGISIHYERYDNATNYTPSAYEKDVISCGVYLYY